MLLQKGEPTLALVACLGLRACVGSCSGPADEMLYFVKAQLGGNGWCFIDTDLSD